MSCFSSRNEVNDNLSMIFDQFILFQEKFSKNNHRRRLVIYSPILISIEREKKDLFIIVVNKEHRIFLSASIRTTYSLVSFLFFCLCLINEALFDKSWLIISSFRTNLSVLNMSDYLKIANGVFFLAEKED